MKAAHSKERIHSSNNKQNKLSIASSYTDTSSPASYKTPFSQTSSRKPSSPVIRNAISSPSKGRNTFALNYTDLSPHVADALTSGRTVVAQSPASVTTSYSLLNETSDAENYQDCDHYQGLKPPVCPSSIVRNKSAVDILGSGSPIPCGDSFFEDDVEMTQRKMAFMKGFRKSLSSPTANSSFLDKSDYQDASTMGKLENNDNLVARKYNDRRISDCVYKPHSAGSEDISESCRTVSESMNKEIHSTSLNNSGDIFSRTGLTDYTFDYSISESPMVCKLKNGAQNKQTSVDDTEYFSDELPNIDDFQDEFEDEFDAMVDLPVISEYKRPESK